MSIRVIVVPIICIGLSLLYSRSLRALEGHPYLHWKKVRKGQKLADYGPKLDLMIKKSFLNSLKVINSQGIVKSCSQVVKTLAEKLAKKKRVDGSHRYYNLLLKFNNHFDGFFIYSKKLSPYRWPVKLEMNAIGFYNPSVSRSIYRNVTRFRLWRWFAPTLKIYGVYLTADKIDHMLFSGLNVFSKFVEYRKQGFPYYIALRKAYDDETAGEMGVNGFISSAVISFSDLMANGPGFKYWEQFCSQNDPILKKDNQGKWTLAWDPSFKKFTLPALDESWKTSYFYDNKFNVHRFFMYYRHPGLVMNFGMKVARIYHYLTKIRSIPYNNSLSRRWANIFYKIRPELKKFCKLQYHKTIQKMKKRYTEIEKKRGRVGQYFTSHLKFLVKNRFLPNPGLHSLKTICTRN